MPNIEQLSTNELTDLLLNTGYMETYINTNDREPSWDGNIYMYNDYCYSYFLLYEQNDYFFDYY